MTVGCSIFVRNGVIYSMTIKELKDQIVSGKLSNFYIFVGEEIGIINIYLKQMSKKLNLPITRASNVASVYGMFSGGSLFGDTTGFYVVRDDKDFTKQDSVLETIHKDLGKNTLVLLFDKLDSRLKFTKTFKDDIITFEKLTPSVLSSYITREINLSSKNIERLMQICNYSYDMCMLEIDKIKQYKQAVDESEYNICFSDLLDDGSIYQPEETDVFQFTEAVCTRNSNSAFALEQKLRESGVSSINILGTLYNSLKSVMLIQCCEGDIAQTTGLDNGQIYFNKKYVNKYYGTGELVNGVKLLIKIIDGVKNGWIEDEYATRYALSFIM